VLEDAAGLAELRRLGARSVPVLSRGDEFVFAQNIAHVVKFLGLNEKTGPVLMPAQLIARLERFLDIALRIIPQMPDDKLETEVPNRPRSYRVLGHHMFNIADTFLQVAADGDALTYEKLTVRPPDTMRTTADITAFGAGVRNRLDAWWTAKPDKSGRDVVQTYYGPQLLHEYLERTTWHVGQHTRQWVMLLGMHGITPDGPPGEADFANLPMPSSVWDG
jgi:hypothetical protein